MNKKGLREHIDKLIQLGEDKDELEYWYDIFDALTTEHQERLFQNLENELKELGAK